MTPLPTALLGRAFVFSYLSYVYGNGSLLEIGYSDDTPDVAFTHDRLGRMTSAIVAGISTNAYTYHPDTLALSVETQNGMEINRTTDAFGRDTGFSLTGSDYAVTYGFDAYGRFQSLTSASSATSAVTFTYSYLQNTDLLSGMTASRGYLWTRAYESGRSLITSVENRYNDTTISRYDYQNDALGRRVSRADSGLAFAAQPTYGDSATVEMPAYNDYSYNTRSEITGATRRWGTPGASGDLVLGQQYAYEFDPIGNRITAVEGDTDRTASYTANALNQYTQRTVPDEMDLIGIAPTNVAVTVNQNPVSRQFAYWHHALEVDNATDAAYPQVAITAVYNPPGTNDPDVVTSQTGRVFVAQTPEAFTYDDDGNLTQDGRFDYTWDGENRLIKAETRGDLPASVARVKVEYAYDHRGRMVWKQISTNAVAISSRTLLWDGYNIVRETVAVGSGSPQSVITNHYVWGLDLTGSLQGAGGVGGLLAEVKDGVPYFAAFDANGNICEYLSADGTLAAHYEYSPFGEIVVQSGDLADSFTHRFSTKPWCPVTGLSEYEFRKYSPPLGRWMSRDPIGERGGLGLYGFVLNGPLQQIDSLGLVCIEGTKRGVSSGTFFSPGMQNPDSVKQSFDFMLAILILSDMPIPGLTKPEDLANMLLNTDLPWGMDVAAVALQLAEFNKLLRLTKEAVTVWTKVQCQECVCKNWFTGWPFFKPKKDFAWENSGDDHWVKCDLIKTEWGAARQRMPAGTVGIDMNAGSIAFRLFNKSNIEKIRKQCNEQANSTCVK